MLELYKTALNYLEGAISGDFYPYCAVVFGLLPFVAFLVELTVVLIKKPKEIYVYSLRLSLVFFVLEAYFTVFDYVERKLLFSTVNSVVIYLALSLVKVVILHLVLRLIYKQRLKNSCKKPIKTLEELPPSNVKPFFAGEVIKPSFTGFINVEYLKGLIQELKTKKLELSDLCELEDFEVYLLNFVSREPNDYERKVLSTRVNSLIKKIARYEAG